MSEEKDDKNKVNEPSLFYGQKVRIFHSFEEQKEYEISQILKIEPIDRLRMTVDLILRAYGISREELNKRIPDNKITVRYFE